MIAAQFHSGFMFWIRGWRHILSHGSLFTLALIPFLIVLLGATGLAYLLWNHLPEWVALLVNKLGLQPGLWHDVLYYPTLVAMTLLTCVTTVYVFYLLQGLVAVPFYSFLADRTLSGLGKKPNDDRMWNEWARHSLRMLRVSLIKTFVLLVAGVVLFVFQFLPILNFFAAAGVLLILASDCMDYSLEALGLGLRQRLGYFFRYWAQWFGMAAGLALTLLVPGLTLLVIPGAVVGAALIVKNEKNNEL